MAWGTMDGLKCGIEKSHAENVHNQGFTMDGNLTILYLLCYDLFLMVQLPLVYNVWGCCHNSTITD
jgi:hypothetical protein